MKRGKLIVFTGPSGVGKGTIKGHFLNDKKFNMIYSVSTTTRLKRAGELEGQDYFFVSTEEFKSRITRNLFLEWAIFVDNYYGTEKAFVEENLVSGRNVFLEIEVLGGLQIFQKFTAEDLVAIFILPPSLEELKNRLQKRSTDDGDIITQRVEVAREEIKFASKYQYQIINKDLKTTLTQINQIFLKELSIDG